MDDEVDSSAAERAFEVLRAEVATLRREIAQMLRQGQAVAAVDYSPTLGEMAQTLAAVQERLAGIEAKPALGLTAAAFSQQIEEAGQRAGARAGQAMAEGAAAQRAATHELEGLAGRAYVCRRQRQWLAVAVAGGVLLGVGLWYVLPAMLPWGGGDWLAASLIGGSPWQAGQALMRAGNPSGFNRLVHLSQACGSQPVARCIAGIARETTMQAGSGPDPAAARRPPQQR